MSDASLPPPTAAPGPATPSRWLKPALLVSVALNLAFLGAIGGALWKGLPEGRSMTGRDLGFGPFSEALLPQDREAMARALLERGGSPREMRRAMMENFSALLAALRSEPFEPDAVRAVFADFDANGRERLRLGQQLLEERIIAMSPAERAEFAGRLEDRLSRRPLRGDGDADGN